MWSCSLPTRGVVLQPGYLSLSRDRRASLTLGAVAAHVVQSVRRPAAAQSIRPPQPRMRRWPAGLRADAASSQVAPPPHHPPPAARPWVGADPPCTLTQPEPYTLHPTPCTLHPALCTLHSAPGQRYALADGSRRACRQLRHGYARLVVHRAAQSGVPHGFKYSVLSAKCPVLRTKH